MVAHPILLYVWCPIAFIVVLLAATRDGRRLLTHCVRTLLNGKSPLRWLAGLLAGILPPVGWTMAFKLARNIPDEWRPDVGMEPDQRSLSCVTHATSFYPFTPRRSTLICFPSSRP